MTVCSRCHCAIKQLAGVWLHLNYTALCEDAKPLYLTGNSETF